MQGHQDLQGEALGRAVDQQPWDPSVKALTAFPSVLGNMDKNLSWTSSLGDAYYNQQDAVMDAVQTMRQQAQAAGNLKTTSQQVVTDQGSTIVVQPANPDIVYVPAYDPWDGLRGSPHGVAGMVPVSRNLVWRPVPFVRDGFWSRLLRGFWVGLESLGMQLGWPFYNFWRRQILLPEQHVYNRNSFYRGGGFNRGGALRGGAFSRGGGRGFNRGGMRGGGFGARSSPFNGNNRADSRIRVLWITR